MYQLLIKQLEHLINMNINELKKTIEVKIPDSDLVINIKSELPWYDEIELSSIKKENDQIRFLMWKMIDSWNLVEDDGSPVPITKDITDKFSKKIIFPIYKEILKNLQEKHEKKKNSLKNLFFFFKEHQPKSQKNG